MKWFTGIALATGFLLLLYGWTSTDPIEEVPADVSVRSERSASLEEAPEYEPAPARRERVKTIESVLASHFGQAWGEHRGRYEAAGVPLNRELDATELAPWEDAEPRARAAALEELHTRLETVANHLGARLEDTPGFLEQFGLPAHVEETEVRLALRDELADLDHELDLLVGETLRLAEAELRTAPPVSRSPLLAVPVEVEGRRPGGIGVTVEEAGWHVRFRVELSGLAPWEELRERSNERFFRLRDVVQRFKE